MGRENGLMEYVGEIVERAVESSDGVDGFLLIHLVDVAELTIMFEDDAELHKAYMLVLSDYVMMKDIDAFQTAYKQYVADTAEQRERNCEPH